MRTQIKKQPGTWEILLAPGSRLQVRSKTIEATLVLGKAPEEFAIQHLLNREEIAVPPAILKHAQDAAYLAREFDESIGIRGGIREGLVDDHMLPCLQGARGNVVVRRVRSGDNHQRNGVVSQ